MSALERGKNRRGRVGLQAIVEVRVAHLHELLRGLDVSVRGSGPPMLPWRRPEPSPEGEGVLWGHLARVGARRRPAQPSFELVYSLSVS